MTVVLPTPANPNSKKERGSRRNHLKKSVEIVLHDHEPVLCGFGSRKTPNLERGPSRTRREEGQTRSARVGGEIEAREVRIGRRRKRMNREHAHSWVGASQNSPSCEEEMRFIDG
ncbi:hypothetical protein BHE74_00048884 [Ensete ventricosum]|nr:hypothetical protein BHE74_00048884 [Ensete ventricosum]